MMKPAPFTSLPSTIVGLTPTLIKASGYVYRNGYDTPAQFREAFGFDATNHPRYFRITATGLVVALSTFVHDCRAHFENVRANYARIGL